jgi:hypothetical protein
VLRDLSPTHGRDWVALALMTTPEFYDCWTQILMDHMQVQRSGEFSAARELRQRADVPGRSTDAQTVIPATPPEPLQRTPTLPGPCMAKAEPRWPPHPHRRALATSSWTWTATGVGRRPGTCTTPIRAALLTDDLHVAWRPVAGRAGRRRAPRSRGESTDNEVKDAFLMPRPSTVNTVSVSRATPATYSKSPRCTAACRQHLGPDREHGASTSTAGCYGTGEDVITAQDPTGVYAAKCGSYGCHGPRRGRTGRRERLPEASRRAVSRCCHARRDRRRRS